MPENVTPDRCPKCGSPNVVQGECLKCGVIVSRFQQPAKFDGPSYPVTPIEAALSGADEQMRRLARARKQTQLIGFAIVAVLALGGYFLYKTFKIRAAAFGGEYKNLKYVFVLRLPDQGWSHFSEEDARDLGIKNTMDAFWKGDDPNQPELLLVIHGTDPGAPIPEYFTDEAAVAKLKQATADYLQEAMEEAGYECVLSHGERKFDFEANLVKEGRELESLIFSGYHNKRLFAVQFIGTPQAIEANREEIAKIGRSLNFHIAVI